MIKDKNAVRVIELPACKMVWSGVAVEENAWAEDGRLGRFIQWFNAQESLRKDRFYPHNFLWSGNGGFAWGYAVAEVPEDTGGFEVMDFPGGLFAVAVSIDADGKDHDQVNAMIQKWVEKSGCFALDENPDAGRNQMGNIITAPAVHAAMGYNQMELYFPIKIKS